MNILFKKLDEAILVYGLYKLIKKNQSEKIGMLANL